MGDATLDHKISVTVQVDLDGKNVRIITTGCLTRFSQSALLPIIRRARGLTPGIRVTVDTSPARHIEAAGLEILRDALDYESSQDNEPPVQLLIPTPLPSHYAAANTVPPHILENLPSAPLTEVAS